MAQVLVQDVLAGEHLGPVGGEHRSVLRAGLQGEDRDWLAGTPWHKYVRARLEVLEPGATPAAGPDAAADQPIPQRERVAP